MTAVDRLSLAKHVKARRAEMDWTQLDVWNRGGPSNSKLTEIERGDGPEPSRATLRKLDTGLGWQPGSARRVLAGGDPSPIADVTVGGTRESDDLIYRTPAGMPADDWERIKRDSREHIEWLIERVARER